MSARRLARELAVITLPQLPKDEAKLEKLELDLLVSKAVQMLCDYAKQNLADANGLLVKADQELGEIEIEHGDNATNVEDLSSVTITTGQLRHQLDLIERSLHLVSEALDIPEIATHSAHIIKEVNCKKCDTTLEVPIQKTTESDVLQFFTTLIMAYTDHREQIDGFLKQIKVKWRLDRMISIDRDILRLACAELFFMPDVPVKVAINEAVELTHRFADARAAKFINGVLADLAETAGEFRRSGEFKLPEAQQELSETLSSD